jgi:ubiquinone/menaquinone biosynthesis C-methylase UbiE
MIEVFEESAVEYDEWFMRHALVYGSELEAVKALMPLEGRGMEIGVGTGRFAGPLGIKVGVELSRAMAEIAKTRGIKVIQGDAQALPFADGSFDFLLIITVLCFLHNPVQALYEATRVLKSTGRLIIGMIDPDSPLGRYYEQKREQSKFYRQAKFHPVRQVLDWVEALGYENFMTCQTLFKGLEDVPEAETMKPGHGEGAFVVMAAQKSTGSLS